MLQQRETLVLYHLMLLGTVPKSLFALDDTVPKSLFALDDTVPKSLFAVAPSPDLSEQVGKSTPSITQILIILVTYTLYHLGI